MEEKLRQAISNAAEKVATQKLNIQLSRPDPQFGDFATNVALVLAKTQGKEALAIARSIAAELKKSKDIKEVAVAGPGFINIRLSDWAIGQAAAGATKLPGHYTGQEILVEFGDPNPFKEMHIGHAYSYIVGDALSSLLEATGAKVQRLSYHGDVGLHVAKAIWGMQQAGIKPDSISDKISQNIGLYYAKGAKAYETDAAAKLDIDHINQHIYAGGNKQISQLYEWGKQTSLAYFDNVLQDLAIHSPQRFYESEAAKQGSILVQENDGRVFEKSDGAIVYQGEKVGLHTRVFITSAGLPTYETKDLGLAKLKDDKYPEANQSIIITANEQAEYFKVMLAALAEIDKPLADKTKHLYHGFVSLSTGKMSSRTGEVYSAVSLILDVGQAVEKEFKQASDPIRNAAIKYGFLKHRLGSDIVYDVAQSISLNGNSGPYLQYAHARAASILAKTKVTQLGESFDEFERALALKLSEYQEVFTKAVDELMPHHICTYLYELCQEFNRFYEHCRVAGDDREAHRAGLVKAYKDVLANGLGVLNIAAPEKV